MRLSTFAIVAAALLVHMRPAQAKSYKGAEVYLLQPVLHGRMEMRMRMIRGSGLVSTFFTYKNGSEMSGALWEEIDIEALGKNGAKTWQSNIITGNPSMRSEQIHSEPSSLADGYHTYTLEWTPEYVSWSFDGMVVRKTEGGQTSALINAESLRFNAWASDSTGWVGALDDTALPAYQYVNWIKYYRYDNGQFVLDWTDDFNSFDSSRWGKGDWTFDGNLVDFDPANAVIKDGTLILAITKEGATGFAGTVPADDGSTGGKPPASDSGCTVGGSQPHGAGAGGLCAMLIALGVAAGRRRPRAASSQSISTRLGLRAARPLVASRARLTIAALLLAMLAPRVAAAVQGAELYRTEAYFYGRFETRVRFAPGEGVVSAAFLWKDGSSSTTSWNELDYEKVNANCRLQTNIWTGTGTQSTEFDTPTFDICSDYHTYAFEWTPDYIAWLIDGKQVRKVTGASVTEYTQNASAGMTIHFNLWAGDSTFGGTFNPSILPVHQYISWVQYSSYANGAFQLQWREDFNDSTMPTGWAAGDWALPLNHSTNNPANVSFVNGIAVLSMTADDATGFTGTPPADPLGGGGASGTGGAGGRGGVGAGGASGATGGGGRGGAGGRGTPGSGGTSSTGSGGSDAGGGASGSGATTGTAGSGTGGPSGSGGASGTGGTSGSGGASGSGGSSGTGGASGTGGSSGTGGASSGGSGGAAAGTGGAPGTGADASADARPQQTGSGAGCGCRAAGGGLTASEGSIAALLIAACALRRWRRVRRS